jgi:hypothetical protein
VNYNTEKEELKKSFFKIQNRESQFQTELRRKDQTIKTMQDQVRKLQAEKNINYRNSFELAREIQENGPKIFSNKVK